jgi:nitrogen fixation-related uncharacterized protein
MQTLLKSVALATPALLLVVYLWAGKSNKYESQMAVDSAAIDRDFARINEAVEKDKKLKAEFTAEKISAHKRYSSSEAEAKKTKEAADNDLKELQKAVNEMDRR